MSYTRRHFLGQSAATSIALGLPGLSVAQGASSANPNHFFLTFFIQDGVDNSQLFDARPRSFAEHGKLKIIEYGSPTLWQGSNGGQCLVHALAAPLLKHKDILTVVNGIIMDAGADGHEQNINYFFTKSSNGGVPFFSNFPLLGNPYLMDSIFFQDGDIEPEVELKIGKLNYSDPSNFITLNSIMTSLTTGNRQENFQFVRSLLDKVGDSRGAFSRGSGEVKQAFNGVPQLEKAFARIGKLLDIEEFGNLDKKDQYLEAARAIFSSGISQSVVIDLTELAGVESFDMHSEAEYRSRPFIDLVETIDFVIEYLKKTPLKTNSTESLLDHTSVIVTSEFGRTMRQLDVELAKSGTDHNPLSNFALIFGKGIKGGQVIGASDLDRIDEKGNFGKVSPTHLSMDQSLIKCMGKPFDFVDNKVLHNLYPERYEKEQYLNMVNIMNTLMTLMGVQHQNLWSYGNAQNSQKAPIVKSLLK